MISWFEPDKSKTPIRVADVEKEVQLVRQLCRTKGELRLVPIFLLGRCRSSTSGAKLLTPSLTHSHDHRGLRGTQVFVIRAYADAVPP